MVVPPRVARRERPALRVVRRGTDELLALRVEKGRDRVVQAELRERLRLTRPRPEARAPEQPFGLRHAELPPVGVRHPHRFMVAPDGRRGIPEKGVTSRLSAGRLTSSRQDDQLVVCWTNADGHQPVRLLASARARRDHRPRRGDARAARARRRRPLRPALCAPEVRQDEPAAPRAGRRGAGGGADPGARRPVPGRLDRRRDGSARTGLRPPSEGRGAGTRRPVPTAHRHRALARGARDQRRASSSTRRPIRCPRCTRCSTCRCGSSRAGATAR